MIRIRLRGCVLSTLVALSMCTALLATPAAGARVSAKPTGPPVKIMAMGPFSDPQTGYESPEWPGAAQARAKHVNTHGFLKDASGVTHKLVVIVCDAGIDPNLAEQCARQAVDEQVAAAVGYNGPSGAIIIPILQAAGIPFIGNYPNDALATSAENSFPLVSGGAGLFAGLPLQLQAEGADSQYYAISDLGAATTGFIQVMVQATTDSSGIKLNDSVILAADQVDLAPVVAAATQGDTTGVGIFILGDTAKNFVNTLRNSGHKQTIGTIAPFISNEFVSDLGGAAKGLLVTGTTRFQKTTKAGRMYAADMKAFNKKLPVNDAGASYWLSTWVFERVATTLPTIDAASVLEAMGKLHDFDMGGMTPPISTDTEFTGKSPFPLPRLFNPTVVYYEAKNGKLVEVDGEFVDPFAG